MLKLIKEIVQLNHQLIRLVPIILNLLNVNIAIVHTHRQIHRDLDQGQYEIIREVSANNDIYISLFIVHLIRRGLNPTKQTMLMTD